MKVSIAQLQKWYTEYNNKVFGNILPTTMPFILTNTRTYLGKASWHRRNFVYSYDIKISNYFDIKEEDFRSTLVHEMCHIYCYVKGWYKEHHGARWKAIAAKASAITGFNITRLANITDWQVSEENKVKEERRKERKQAKREAPSIIVEMRNGAQYFLLKTTDSVIDKHISEYPRNGWYIANIYVTDNPMFKNWIIRKCLHWGYMYDEKTYNQKFKPIFDVAEKRQILSVRRASVAR